MEALILFLLFYPLAASVGGYFLTRRFTRIREAFFTAAAGLELAAVILLAAQSGESGVSVTLPGLVGEGLSFSTDPFRILYTVISVFLWFSTTVFAKEYMHHYEHKERYYLFCFATLTGVVGVFLSADLFTTFCFFELMSFASYPLVIHEENRDAMRAGETYLAVAVIGGMLMLVGLFFLQSEAGSLRFELLRAYYAGAEKTALTYAGGILILLGFGAKAGMYPLHIWLPKAHPVAPAPASALLSGILTKTGVFGIIVLCADVFAGNRTFGTLLLALAVITMFLGAVLALFSNNLKRTLACSSMSQIGFILTGLSFTVLLGQEGGLAQSGALLHMVNHSLIKLVLFMCAGVVAMNLHALNLNRIRGFGRKKPFLMVIFLIGALGIMGVPLFNGYVSKTMIHESIVEFIELTRGLGGSIGIWKAVEWVFLISGGLTVAYMTKLFFCLFIEKNEDPVRQTEMDRMTGYLTPLSRVIFVLSAIPLCLIGVMSGFVTKDLIAPAHEFFGVEKLAHIPEFFGWECLKGGLISLAIGALVFLTLVRRFFMKGGRYADRWPEKVDLEEAVYRPLLINGNLFFIRRIVTPIAMLPELLLTKGVLALIRWVVTPIALFAECVLIRGTLLFTLYIVRFFAQLFDLLIVLLNKTMLRPHVYRFRDRSAGDRVSELIEKVRGKKDGRYSAGRMNAVFGTLGESIHRGYNSYSFAFAMISLGIIIVLLFAVLH